MDSYTLQIASGILLVVLIVAWILLKKSGKI